MTARKQAQTGPIRDWSGFCFQEQEQQREVARLHVVQATERWTGNNFDPSLFTNLRERKWDGTN